MTDDLSLDKWDRMPARERQTYARRLARELPEGFTFRAIEAHKLGDQAHRMAVYSFQETLFVLVPGGEVALGYDANCPWEPTPDEHESWRNAKEEYGMCGIRGTIQKYIAKVTRKLRTVRLKPFLMETTAGEMGWEPIAADDPQVEEIVRGLLRSRSSHAYTSTIHSGRAQVRVRRLGRGKVCAERAVECTHAELTEELARTGFRFPTSDEWEYTCGAGAATLFRWGDHAPCDRYPVVSPAAAKRRRRRVLSGGKSKHPREGFPPDWDLHRRPNAFGLLIAPDPYKFELVAEPGITRGGDGGHSMCGGMVFFLGWLSLATAYFQKEACKRDAKEPIQPGFTIGRRVLPLE
jgi:formylglycine-generating enzyme required for sulfatase activity